MSEGTMVAPARGYYEMAAERAGVRALPEEPLARHTTMHVGGPAQWFFLPETPESAARLWSDLTRGDRRTRAGSPLTAGPRGRCSRNSDFSHGDGSA